jgi:hypothetical protein
LITYDLNLCIGEENPDKKLTVKCHDTGVNLRVRLVVCKPGKWQNEYVPYSIPAGSTAVLKITKPDEKYCITDGDAGSTEILFEMVPQAFTVAGICKAEVSLHSPDGKRITSSTFHIDVPEECICGCDLESENYIDVMSEQIRAAIDAANRAEAAAVHGPIIHDGYWWLWNPDTMQYEDSGYEASPEADLTGVVRTVNGKAPDENGNLDIPVYGGGSLNITDDENGNVSISSTGSVSITDDGEGNVSIT